MKNLIPVDTRNALILSYNEQKMIKLSRRRISKWKSEEARLNKDDKKNYPWLDQKIS